MKRDIVKFVDRKCSEYEIVDKFPMTAKELLKYRGFGNLALEECRRRGWIIQEPFQWAIDIHPKLRQIEGHVENIEELKAAFRNGRFQIVNRQRVKFDRIKLRNFGLTALKQIAEKLSVECPKPPPSKVNQLHSLIETVIYEAKTWLPLLPGTDEMQEPEVRTRLVFLKDSLSKADRISKEGHDEE